MASAINPTEPRDGSPAATAGLRANLEVPKTGLALQLGAADNCLRIDGAS